jgi:hypothetical protein
MCTTRLYNNLHQVSHRMESQIYSLIWTLKPKGLHGIANIGQGHACLREESISFSNITYISNRIWWEVSFPSNMIILQSEIHNIEYWWLAVPNSKYQPTGLTMASASPCGWWLSEWVSEWKNKNIDITFNVHDAYM